MSNYRPGLLPIVLLTLGALHCGGDEAEPTPTNCVDEPDRTIDGEARPFADFMFLNAFDPSAPMVYDPNDATSVGSTSMGKTPSTSRHSSIRRVR